jgi:hypothetical protein
VGDYLAEKRNTLNAVIANEKTPAPNLLRVSNLPQVKEGAGAASRKGARTLVPLGNDSIQGCEGMLKGIIYNPSKNKSLVIKTRDLGGLYRELIGLYTPLL